MAPDQTPAIPPPLPPLDATPRRQKRSFWRTPVGVLAALGLVMGALIFGALGFYGFMIGSGQVPDAAAVAGRSLPAAVVKLLKDNEVIEADERIRYYYSAGLFDHLEDGHLISDDRVVWFWRSAGSEDAVDLYSLEYHEISDIRVVWGEGFLDDTIITIVDEDEDETEIWVSTDEGGDRKYHRQLLKLWHEHR